MKISAILIIALILISGCSTKPPPPKESISDEAFNLLVLSSLAKTKAQVSCEDLIADIDQARTELGDDYDNNEILPYKLTIGAAFLFRVTFEDGERHYARIIDAMNSSDSECRVNPDSSYMAVMVDLLGVRLEKDSESEGTSQI